ncbi:MAG: hypothetical protein U9O56_06965 [Campylobacterota bacterium]|nr:hypothetical protein [Campylobacterota bacterium]
MKQFFASFKIFLQLFKGSLFKMMLLVFVSFFIITIIPIIINSYNKSLENSLATKQPHLIIKYIDENKIFKQEKLLEIENNIQNILGIKNIDSINSFVKSSVAVKFKSYGYNLSEYNGYVDAIGLSSYRYPITYDFDTILPVMLSDYGFKLTGVEIFQRFKDEDNIMFFNETLYKSIQPLVTYEAKFDMSYFINETQSNHSGKFFGVVEDFFDKPIVYMDYKFLNKILGYDENHISGFMINIKDQKKLNILKKDLENFFNKDTKQVLVSSWRDINKKQNDIFKIFTEVGLFLKWIILILSTAAVSIYLYKTLLIKQPELRLLNILGLRLISIVNTTVAFITFITVLLSSFAAHSLMLYIYKNILFLDMQIDIGFYIYDIILSYTILVFFAVVIVNSLFKQNYNIFK